MPSCYKELCGAVSGARSASDARFRVRRGLFPAWRERSPQGFAAERVIGPEAFQFGLDVLFQALDLLGDFAVSTCLSITLLRKESRGYPVAALTATAAPAARDARLRNKLQIGERRQAQKTRSRFSSIKRSRSLLALDAASAGTFSFGLIFSLSALIACRQDHRFPAGGHFLARLFHPTNSQRGSGKWSRAIDLAPAACGSRCHSSSVRKGITGCSKRSAASSAAKIFRHAGTPRCDRRP